MGSSSQDSSSGPGLPLDDCPLLAAHCQLYGPVVAAVAGWPSSPSQQLPAGLRTAVKQCVVAQLAAAGSSSGRQQAWGSGRRRTLLPNTFLGSINSLPELEAAMTSMLQIYFKVPPALQQGLSPLPQLLRAVVQQVAQEQAVERNSPAFDTIIQAGLSAGLVAAGCVALHSALGVTLSTGQQLFEALKVTCEAVVTPRARDQQLPFTRTAYQDLCAIAAAVGNGSGDSSSSSSSGGGGGSSSSGRAPAVPKCGWDVAFMVLCDFGRSLASPLVQLESVNTGAFLSGGDALRSAATGVLAPMMGQPVSERVVPMSVVGSVGGTAAEILRRCNLFNQPESGSGVAGSSSTPAAAQIQEAESWGKGQGLAGLKGLFASKSAAAAAGAAATPAAQPVAAKASSSGKGQGAAAAPASAAAATGAKQAAAAAAGTGSKGSAKQSDSSSAGSKAKQTGGSSPGSQSTSNASTAPKPPAATPLDASLPLDECRLLSEHCQLLGPVVAAVASSLSSPGQQEAGPLRAAIKQYLAAQLAAGGSSSSSSSGQQPAGGGGRRLTMLPKLWPLGTTPLDDIQQAMTSLLEAYYLIVPGLQQVLLPPLSRVLQVVVQEVAQEQAVGKTHPAFDTLVQAALTTGAVAAGCAALQAVLGVRLTTGQQLFEALKATCMPFGNADMSAPSVRAAAVMVCQTLRQITAAGGSSSSGSGRKGISSGGSSGSDSKGPAIAVPKCGVDVALSVLYAFQHSLVVMAEQDGDPSVAGPLSTVKSPAAAEEPTPTDGTPAPGAAGSSSSSTSAAAAQGHAAGGRGKAQALARGLAGVNGLFASKPAAAAGAAATPAAQPVAVKASSSGAVVVATSSTGKAAASAAAAAVGAKAAAAAPGSSASSTATSSSSNATDPELLVPSNLKRWYCSPDTFDIVPVVPLPHDSLQLLVKLQLHTEHRSHGWNALHYACASHRVHLVEQLLAAGASVSEPEDNALLQPLHLACMGQIQCSEQFHKLLGACEGTMIPFKKFVACSGSSCVPLARLLLSHGADPNAAAGLPASELEGLTPLHILSCWRGGKQGREYGKVFHNPFVGKANVLGEEALPCPVQLSHAWLDFEQASEDGSSVAVMTRVDCNEQGYFTMAESEQAAMEKECAKGVGWGEDLSAAVQHVGLVHLLLGNGALPDLTAGLARETPLMVAAAHGNAAVTAALLVGGADPELMRADSARALEIAADKGFAVVGWTLLCYGARALPDWALGDVPIPPGMGVDLVCPPSSLTYMMLVNNAVQCQEYPWNCLFLQRLLADGAGLEDVWPDTGETPLLKAIHYGDVEMVDLLVAAGADVNARVAAGAAHEGDPAITYLLFKVNKDNTDSAKQILQSLIDAGADLHTWRSQNTGYDLVQTAANTVNLDAALKLVEAGCKWQLPKGQRVQDGCVNYAPEILSIESPNLKLAYVEGRFRLAEKVGRQKRAATATALQPWLSPDVTPECKEATLRCLVAACVTPGNAHTRQRPLLTSAPSPRVKAQWAGVQAQRAAAAAAGSSTGQQGLGTQPGARQVSAAVDDIDALLKEIESVGGKELNAGGAAATAAAAGSKAGSKKKKKETAAQREARKKEQQRVQQLQAGGSGSDSDREGEVRGSREAARSLPAASSAADMQDLGEQGVVAAPADLLLPNQQQQQETVQKQQQQTVQRQQQQQQEQVRQKQDNSQKGQAARKQQQARASSSETAAAPAGDADVPGPAMQPARQQPKLAPATAVPAAAGLHTPPQASRAARKAATTDEVQQQVASLQQAGTEQQPQQQGVTVAPQGPPIAPPAAPVAVPAAAPQANPSAVAMRPAAFLPPHLRISMPAAPAAGVAPAAGGVGAAVPPPPVLPMPHPAAVQPPPPPAAQQQVPVQERPQGSALQQRMVELAKQHQPQQQAAAQKDAPAPQQQQPQPSSSTGSHVPAVPHAMMDLLQSGSAQHTSTPAAGGTTGARAAQQRAGAKRQPPAAAAAQQNGHSPAAAGKPAAGRPTNSAGAAAGDAGVAKGPKLCLVCAQRRRNVLLIPCRHLVLCAECAEQLHGQGQLSSCPHCKKPCKQHIRVHQS